jgi:hypothetical protein
MLDRRAGAGSDRLKSMHLVLLAFKEQLEVTEGELNGIEACLEGC